VGFTLVGYQLH